jgi:ATP-binding cassette subfamily B protein
MSSGRTDRELFRLLFEVSRGQRRALVGIVALAVVGAALGWLLPVPLKIAVDSVISGKPLPAVLQWVPQSLLGSKTGELAIAVGLYIIITLAMQLQQLGSWVLQTHTGEHLVHEFRSRLYWHAQTVRLIYHERKGASDLSYRIQNDAPALQSILIQGLLPMLSSAVSFVGMMWVIAALQWQLAVIAVAISPALFVLSKHGSSRVRRRWDDVKELDTSAMSIMQETLLAVHTVKAFGREEHETERFSRRSGERAESQIKLATMQARYHLWIGGIIALGTAATLWVGVSEVLRGGLSLGSLLLVIAYLGQLYEPLRALSTKFPELQSWMSSFDRAVAILDEAPEQISVQRPSGVRTRGEIEFDHVSLVYPNGHVGLEDVSFRLPAGARLGVIGASGAGKSTLASLLTRFYEPTDGRILLDGVNICDYGLADLRMQFALVSQEPILFSVSLAENIAYAEPGIGREQIEAAARSAAIHDRIMEMPKGYDTVLGRKGGVRLSGGERQRIAIARAFLKNSPVLVMDEPTSALDMKTEQSLMQSFRAVMRGRTCMIIAHRLQTLRECDMLLALHHGRVLKFSDDVSGELELAQRTLNEDVRRA